MPDFFAEFRAVLRPVKRGQLAKLIDEWAELDADEVAFLTNTRISKADAVKQLISIIKNSQVYELDAESLGTLDLIYLTSLTKSKQWQVYQVASEQLKGDQRYKTSGLFLNLMRQQLSCLLKADVTLIDQHGIYWIRVAIRERRQVLPSVVYIAHVKFSNFIYMTKANKAHTEALRQALAAVLQCESIDPISLSGKCIHSLIDLTVHKHAQGRFSKYRKDNEGNALTEPRCGTKRKAAEEENINIVDEDAPKKKRIQEKIEQTFGTLEQPTLEYVDYKLETQFKGGSYAMAMSRNRDLFHCRIRFEGPNVLEGIKNLAKKGYAEFPMKSHLANVHSSMRNSFVLHQKLSDQTTMSSQQH